MGRSGTSALTRVLSLCGAGLPANLVAPTPENPRGFWEPRATISFNDALLRRCGSSWFDPSLRMQERLLMDGAVDEAGKAACVDAIRGFLTTLPDTPLTVVKDLRVTLLSEMWFEAAKQAGYDTAVVIAVRHPQEVMASFGAMYEASPELSGALWLKYTLMAERMTRGMPRVFVDYANLLDDWHLEVKRISTALQIDLDTPDSDAIEEFLTPDLRRQSGSGPVGDIVGTDWMATVYEASRAAARDEPWEASELDRVFEAYGADDTIFRAAFDEFRDRRHAVLDRRFVRKLVNACLAVPGVKSTLTRPTIWKLIRPIRRGW
jgi:hypothetical protein